MKIVNKVIALLCIITLTGCASNLPVETTRSSLNEWDSQVYAVCKANTYKSVNFQDNKPTKLRIQTKTSRDPIVTLGVLNALVFIGSAGFIPMCEPREVVVTTNLDTTYKFSQIGCMGWLFWSQELRYRDVCKSVASNLSDEILYDLFDQGKFKGDY